MIPSPNWFPCTLWLTVTPTLWVSSRGCAPPSNTPDQVGNRVVPFDTSNSSANERFSLFVCRVSHPLGSPCLLGRTVSPDYIIGSSVDVVFFRRMHPTKWGIRWLSLGSPPYALPHCHGIALRETSGNGDVSRTNVDTDSVFHVTGFPHPLGIPCFLWLTVSPISEVSPADVFYLHQMHPTQWVILWLPNGRPSPGCPS